MKIASFLFLMIFLGVFSQAQTRHIPLNTSWTFHCDSMEKPLPATVPGNCYLDLMDHKIIPDVYYADNEEKYQWPGETEFTYTLSFDYDQEAESLADLVFYGLDTYADIYLNDSLLKQTDNMFIIWEIPVDGLLKEHNELKIIFHPVVKTALPIKEAYPYDLPADSDQGDEKTSVFTRKAGYQYGWDFAPRFTGCGIWKPVELRTWKDARIGNVYYRTKELEPEHAKMIAEIELVVEKEADYQLKLIGFDLDQPIWDTSVYISNENRRFRKNFSLELPKPWWPNGMGEPTLYSVKMELYKDGLLIDSDERNVGVRTIELVQEEDEVGESFYFEVNGEKIFAQGANWVPPDMFLSTRDSAKYEEQIQLARDAHFNMLRVWGGGVYADDYFYELCDKNGILVWQDFMFACAFYPFDSTNVLSIAEEARDNIIRIRNHASLALWCGNNEIDEAWYNWGYQKKLGWLEADSTEIWKQYKNLFHYLLPEVVQYTDPATDYISTSPKYGWGRTQSMTHGDSHYWGVWWGMQPFEIYREKTGRFMSEYGFQALPDETTLMKMAGKVDSIWDPQWKAHQNHPTGFETINAYMEREFDIPEDPYDYAYLSQILQARGLTIAFISHRMNEFCYGTLFWQFNEPWPGINWAAVDYFGKPKALYYEAKRCFAPQYIFAENINEHIEINLLSSEALDSIELIVKLFSTNGEKLYELRKMHISVNGNSSLMDIAESKLLDYGKKDELILYFVIHQKAWILAENFFTFVPLSEIKLQKPDFTFTQSSKGFVEIKTDKPAFYVHPHTDKTLQNDYFILLPGMQRTIEVDNPVELRSLYDVLY